MFRFENPVFLYLLLMLPLFVLLYAWWRYERKRRLARVGDRVFVEQLTDGVSVLRPLLKFLLCLLALASLIMVVARPQMGLKVETSDRKGIELMVALDVSNSMMATDVSPNRMEKAKMIVSNISDKLSDDKVGLIVFAGDAFIQLPITSDMVSARMFLDAINPSMVAVQGTNIGDALRLAINGFTNQKNVERAIVVITDGEDHEGEAEEMATEAAKKGMHVFVMGIGSEKGATIPVNGGRDYLKDGEGNVVVTKLNTAMCQQIAEKGKGAYIPVDNSNVAQDRLYYELNKLEKQDLGTATFSEYDEQFMVFAAIALVLLIVEMLIWDKKNPRWKRIKLFRHHEKL